MTKTKQNTPQISGWGRQFVPGREVQGEDLQQLTKNATLSRGLARSYGDSALPPKGCTEVVGTVLANRILSFSEKTGILRAEAGLALSTIVELYMPRGWFVPVTPGTKYVTLGGMVASDVHGKNHHRQGCFGDHVTSLKMRVASGEIVTCSPSEKTELFDATIGGMGLTGHILEVTFPMIRIPSPWIFQESERIENIDEFIIKLKESGPVWPFSVGWIDCLSQGENMGRGILMKGRWAKPEDKPPKKYPSKKLKLRLPFLFPEFVLGPITVNAFNTLYYWKHFKKKQSGIIHPDTFWYPLDIADDWNLMYGKRGFTQYQCVLPESAGPGVARRFLEVLTKRGGASFLCIIKDTGAEGRGIISFPMPGISIALDIAVRDNTQKLVDDLNQFVIKENGRIYLTKDMFSSEEDFVAMDADRIARFNAVRDKWDPERKLRSRQSVRLLGDPS